MSTQNSLQTTLPLRPRGVAQRPVQPSEGAQPSNKKDVAAKWENYFGKNYDDLARWRELCRDLGIASESFTSKTQCRKALKGIWVNLHDFLAAENKPDDVKFFKSERALAGYTRQTRKIYPRRDISQGDPLRDLLAHVLYPRGGRN